MTRPSIERRTFLRGVGTSLALPWLEAMLPAGSPALAAEAAAAVGPGGVPRRLAFLFVPNGVHMPEWKPEKEGANYDLKPILEPLADVQEYVNVISGLTHDKGRANGDGAGDHARSAASFLTGAQAVKTSGKDIRLGTSVDQLAAQQIGKYTRLPSLEIGCEEGPQAGNCDSGYSCAYSTNMSWRSPTTPVVKEINPRAVFDRLFGGGSSTERAQSRGMRDRYQKSILDFVSADARSLRKKLGATDRRKVDEYLDGIREVERRIEHPEEVVHVGDDMHRPRGVPKNYAEHLRLMGDLMILAFRTDATRVASFMFANAGSNRSYREIEVSSGHHSLSHHRNHEDKIEQIAQINRFHIEQLAYLLRKMKSTPEGDGNLLDSMMLVYGSGLSDGNRHTHHDLPVLLAGKGGGAIESGRHIVYPKETPLMNLYLSLLDRAGAQVETAGDSTGKLNGLGA